MKKQKNKVFAIKKNQKKKNPFILFLFVVVTLLGVFFFVQGKAEVSIYPNTEEVSVTSTVTVNTSEALIDFDNLILPGVIFSDTKEASSDYLSTGTDSKTKKATGVIRVYNKIDPPKDQAIIKYKIFVCTRRTGIYS